MPVRWRDAMSHALYGPGGFFVAGAGPADHFRTSVHASPAFAAALLQPCRTGRRRPRPSATARRGRRRRWPGRAAARSRGLAVAGFPPAPCGPHPSSVAARRRRWNESTAQQSSTRTAPKTCPKRSPGQPRSPPDHRPAAGHRVAGQRPTGRGGAHRRRLAIPAGRPRDRQRIGRRPGQPGRSRLAHDLVAQRREADQRRPRSDLNRCDKRERVGFRGSPAGGGIEPDRPEPAGLPRNPPQQPPTGGDRPDPGRGLGRGGAADQPRARGRRRLRAPAGRPAGGRDVDRVPGRAAGAAGPGRDVRRDRARGHGLGRRPPARGSPGVRTPWSRSGRRCGRSGPTAGDRR